MPNEIAEIKELCNIVISTEEKIKTLEEEQRKNVLKLRDLLYKNLLFAPEEIEAIVSQYGEYLV